MSTNYENLVKISAVDSKMTCLEVGPLKTKRRHRSMKYNPFSTQYERARERDRQTERQTERHSCV